jgi:hypothetical protein
MDFAQVLTNLIVGAVSAWVAGSLGVHPGRAVRAFVFVALIIVKAAFQEL